MRDSIDQSRLLEQFSLKTLNLSHYRAALLVAYYRSISPDNQVTAQNNLREVKLT